MSMVCFYCVVVVVDSFRILETTIFLTNWMSLRKALMKRISKKRYVAKCVCALLQRHLQRETKHNDQHYDEAYEVSQDLSVNESFDARKKVCYLSISLCAQ